MTNDGKLHLLRRVVSRLPGGRSILYLFGRLWFASFGNSNSVFKRYYETNAWGSEESVSGPGSTREYTENIRKKIPEIVERLNISVILDAPCGDYNWWRMIEWQERITYIGGDVVKELVDKNQSSYGKKDTSFIRLDIARDSLPRADLWLCRDCLFHLSDRDIMLALGNFLTSDIEYLLTSNHPNCRRNHNILPGSFRLLNLQLAPFNLGKPLRTIDDWIKGYSVRQLALWDRETLRNRLHGNVVFQRMIKRRRQTVMRANGRAGRSGGKPKERPTARGE